MKNNQTLLAAGALLILALIYYFTQTGSVDTKAIDAGQFTIHRESIGSVQLSNNSGTLVLEASPVGWTLENYPVDTLKLSGLLDQFTNLTVDRLITKNPDQYNKYEVGDQGNTILVLSPDGSTLLELNLGKQGANYAETFVRNPAEEEVYAVKANLSQYKSMAAKDLWDRSITHLDLNQISSVVFKGEISYSLKREGPAWTYDSELVDPDKVTNLLRPLENMNGTGFAAALPAEKSLYESITFGFGDGSTQELNFYKKDEKGAILLVTINTKSKIFEYSSSSLNRFKKSVADLISDPPQN
ncbi:MAG: DUF4340 domain-containing protein [Candidatus Marinimicrobia bacterium]|nr:DUF4340 domain-containing protein [Candidatus Neomarinimicrobiota bacterium]